MNTGRRGLFNKLFMAVVVVAMLGCAMLGQKPFSQWSPKEKATFFMHEYNATYDDYLAQVTQPNLSPAQKDVLKVKKEVLSEVEQPIKDYADYVEKGTIPPQALETQITGLLNRLGTTIAKE